MSTARGNGATGVADRLAELRGRHERGEFDEGGQRSVHEAAALLVGENVFRQVDLRYGSVVVPVYLHVVHGDLAWEATAWAWSKLQSQGMAAAPWAEAWFDRFEWFQLLAYAAHDKAGARIFVDGDDAARALPDALARKLVDEYGELVAQLESIDESIKAQVLELFKKKEWTALKNIAPHMPRSCLDFTVDLLASCLEGKSSTTDSSAATSAPQPTSPMPSEQPSEQPSKPQGDGD